MRLLTLPALLLLCIIAPAISSHSQEVSEAPVRWEMYRASDVRAAVLFPKLPIRFDVIDVCSESETVTYYAYAAEMAYSMRVISKKVTSYTPTFCRDFNRFGKSTLSRRREQLGERGHKLVSTAVNGDIWVLEGRGTPEHLLLVDDMKNDRWIELGVSGRDDFAKRDEFFNSLEFGKSVKGIEIGAGADRMLGDFGVDTSNIAPQPAKKTGDTKPQAPASDAYRSSLVVLSKVKAQYTDKARRNNIQGSVTLRVMFLANGGIGEIEVIKELDHGLTEQAIKAAKKIVFLPQRIDGKPVTTSRPVTFTFNIY